MLELRCLQGDSDDLIDAFCAGTADPQRWRDDLRGCFAEGTLRPEWCWQAVAAGRQVAAHYWWGRPGAHTPHQLVPMDRTDAEAAVRLVVHSREVLGLRAAKAFLAAPAPGSAPVDQNPGSPAALLAASGFTLAVERVRVERRSAAATLGTDEPGLAMRPARELPDDVVVSLLEQVIDGSLDHGMQVGLAVHGATGHARRMHSEFRAYSGAENWFTVGVGADGTPVGYVLPATIDGRAVLAEIGVARQFRGNRYGDELLVHGTNLLVRAGYDRVRGLTDVANHPMRAAFARAAYHEFGRRNDYAWSEDPIRR